MKTAKFIAVFLCGAIVMAGMSFTRSACTMSQDTPADITTPTDVISAETQITAEVTTHTTSEETTAPTDSLTTSATSTDTATTATRTTTTTKTTTSTTRTSTAQTSAKTTAKPTSTTATATTRTASTAKPTTTTTQSSTRTTTTTAATTTTTTAPTFDISKYSTYAMSYGQSIGLIYDSGVSSFDTPLILSSATTSPEKRIRDRLDGYAASGYTRFKVWTEYRESDGKWKLYIAYG